MPSPNEALQDMYDHADWTAAHLGTVKGDNALEDDALFFRRNRPFFKLALLCSFSDMPVMNRFSLILISSISMASLQT